MGNFIVCTFHLILVRVMKSRKFRWTGHVVRMEEGRSASKMLSGRLAGKRPSGRPSRRWEENIRMDLKNIRIGLIPLRIGTI